MVGGIRWALLGVVTWCASSCAATTFQCSDTGECAGRPGGVCEPTGWCSFPDDACPSGRRYGEFSGGSFSNECVSTSEPTSTSTTVVGSESTTTSSPATLSNSGSTVSTSGGFATTGTTETTTLDIEPTDTAGDSTTTTEGSGEASTTAKGGSSSTGASPQVLEITSTLAACTDPTSNSPATCEQSTQTQGMSIDTANSALMNAPTTGFIAFEIDGGLAGATVLSAELRLTATDDINAASTAQSGEVWRCQPFTLASLSAGQPPLLGEDPVAMDQGAVATSEEVTWDIDPADIDLTSTFHIAVVPTSPLGVDYWNSEGMHPPVLRLVVEP